MSVLTLWRPLLGLEETAIEDVRLERSDQWAQGRVLVVAVRPAARQRGRCGRCRRPSPGYDAGRGRRRWRALNHGTVPAFLEADAPRVKCRVHGVVVAHVPWASHGSGHTHQFDEQVAWLAVHSSKKAVTELMQGDRANALKGARFALWRNPENLSEKQQEKLAWIVVNDPRLYRAYLLKEGLRLVFKLPPEQAPYALDRWISWARRSRIPAFVELQRRIVRHRTRILAAIDHAMSNGLVESVNTKIRLLTRMAFGYTNPEALIALAMLALGAHRPALPDRT